MNLSKNTKSWCALIWQVTNQFLLLLCVSAFCAVVVSCAIFVATAEVKAADNEMLYLMDNDFAVIITKQPCNIDKVKEGLGLFVYGRKTAKDKKIEYVGGCYAEKGDNIIIWWEKGAMLISIPARNFKSTIGV